MKKQEFKPGLMFRTGFGKIFLLKETMIKDMYVSDVYDQYIGGVNLSGNKGFMVTTTVLGKKARVFIKFNEIERVIK